MLEDAKAAAPLGTKVVAVTTLTSLDDRDLKTIGVDRAPGEQVLHLTELARASGIDGIVCSGAEVADARRPWPQGLSVVPGARPANGPPGDEKRVATPRAPFEASATITHYGHPPTPALARAKERRIGK